MNERSLAHDEAEVDETQVVSGECVSLARLSDVADGLENWWIPFLLSFYTSRLDPRLRPADDAVGAAPSEQLTNSVPCRRVGLVVTALL